jgi:hypothetical protein
MNFTEIVIVDNIDIHDEQVHLFIHTKDQRVLGLRDVVSNPVITYDVLYVDHLVLGKRFTFAIDKDSYSHMEYYVEQRPDTRKEFDDINSFIDDQIEEFNASDAPTEPDEVLFEDLI